MKLLYELEDSVVGIIVGVLMLVSLGVLPVAIPYFSTVFPIAIGIFLVLNALDVIYFAKDAHEDLKLSLVSLVINIVDILINVGMLALLLGLRLPLISELVVPLLQKYFIVAAGYMILVNIGWIVWYHKD
ncbi:MAG TPA: hypothetical protein VJB16_02965 [archaeon]|nr:hypothetical protein [archaeon]